MKHLIEFTGSDPLSDLSQQPDKNHEKDFIIIILDNPIYFFLQTAYIIYKKGMYRLVALRNNRVLMDRYYNTLKDAKIAFKKFFKDSCWMTNSSVSWSSEFHGIEDRLDNISPQNIKLME